MEENGLTAAASRRAWDVREVRAPCQLRSEYYLRAARGKLGENRVSTLNYITKLSQNLVFIISTIWQSRFKAFKDISF